MLLNGKPPKPGDVFQNPTLAETLRTVAEGGAKAFYNGPIAEKIANFVQKMGGWITTEDMADHYAEWVEPSCTSYRGFDCWQVPPPTQGLNTLMALNIAEGFDLADMGYQSVDAYHHLIESMRLSFGDAMQYIADPAHMNVASTELLSKQYAATRRAMIDPNRAPGHPSRDAAPQDRGTARANRPRPPPAGKSENIPVLPRRASGPQSNGSATA